MTMDIGSYALPWGGCCHEPRGTHHHLLLRLPPPLGWYRRYFYVKVTVTVKHYTLPVVMAVVGLQLRLCGCASTGDAGLPQFIISTFVPLCTWTRGTRVIK